MPEVLGKHRQRPRKIRWFEIGASVFYFVVGVLLLIRGLRQPTVHDRFMMRILIGGILLCATGAMFAWQALKEKGPSRRKLRGKLKRNRIVKPLVLLMVVAPIAGTAQARSDEGTYPSTVQAPSSVCSTFPVNDRKVAVWKARAKLNSERARSTYLNAAERERKIGERLAREVDKNTRFVSDPETQAYVSGVVQKLALHANLAVPFTVKIIEAEDVNVFSLPGGYLYVTTGLFRSTQSEAQLAGLLGHEIAHVLARHGTRQRRKQSIMNWAAMPLWFVGPVGFLVRQVAGITMPLKFSRDAELEADLIGIDLIHAAGFDSSEYLDWLKAAIPCDPKMPSKTQRLFDSYPVFQERVFLIQSRLADMPGQSEMVVTTSEFDEARARWLAEDAPRLRTGANRPVLKRRSP